MAVPAAMMAFVVLRIVADGVHDPASHNMSPFELLYMGSISVVMMAVVYVAFKLCGAKAESRKPY